MTPADSSVQEHRMRAPRSVRFAIIVCSTSRYEIKRKGQRIVDQSGDLIEMLLSNAGHRIVSRILIPDSKQKLTQEIKKAARSPEIDSIVVCGGTGITRKDVTIEVAERLLDKQAPGFGEIFRKLSFDEVGTAAILTRALAGVVNRRILFCLPGSISAVRLAISRLIVPEIGHMVRHASE